MNAASEPESYEEERRLLYVAVTRCRRHLWLIKPEVVAARFGGVGELSPLIRDVAGFERLVDSSSWSAPRDEAEPWRAGEAAARGERLIRNDTAANRLASIVDYFGKKEPSP
jgi:hypothetical protein